MRLRALPVLALPIPNGMWIPARTPAERSLVARIIHQMKQRGEIVVGAPDLAVFWASGAGLIELKRPAQRDLLGKRIAAGKPSQAQLDMAERCAQIGVRYAIAESWDQVRKHLIDWGAICLGR